MEQMTLLLNQYLLYIVGGLTFLVVLLLILVIRNASKIKKMQSRYNKFMSKEDLDLEELLIQYAERLDNLLKQEEEVKSTLEQVERKMKTCVQKVGIIRYKAISNIGADLSFAIALLDEQNDGIVLNGIYGRDGSYTYAKPIKSGKSAYNLSEEEEEAITKALNRESM